MNVIIKSLIFSICTFLLPLITIGVIRKIKARMQNRIGASIFQPLFDVVKLLRKNQTISETTTWIFQVSTAFNAAAILLVACCVPWLSFKPNGPADDLFLVVYVLAAIRFMSILSAMDTGSAFGAFGASREAYLALLVEPAMFIALAALGLLVQSSSLNVIFDYSHCSSVYDVPVWLAAASGLFLVSIVDLSRMPIDDPTTHLELTMVHEAMILENSGKNLALIEYSHLLRMTVLYGLVAQCLLHAATYLWHFNQGTLAFLSIVGIICMAGVTAFIESVSVKMQWRRNPEFIAYALTMSLFAAAGSLIGGFYASHHL